MKHESLRYFVTLSALCAIVFVLGLTPLGIIPIGIINVTILCIPVIIGTLLFGYKGGLILGGFFGLASTLRAFGIPTPSGSGLLENLKAANPLLVLPLSLLPRLCFPLVSWGVYRLVSAQNRSLFPNTPLGRVADSIVFIVLFPVAFILLYAFKLIPIWGTLIGFAFFIVFELAFASRDDHFAIILSSAAGSLTNTVLYLGLMLLFYKAAGLYNNAIFATIKSVCIIAGGTEAMAAAALTGPIIKALRSAKLDFKEK